MLIELGELFRLLPSSQWDLGTRPISALDLPSLLDLVGVEVPDERGNNANLMSDRFRGGV